MHSGRPVAGSAEYKSMWRRQLVTVAVVLGVILLLLVAALYVCLFRSVPLRISKDTTFITGPLKPGGKEVDYFAAWVKEHIPDTIATEENGYRLIVRHLGLPPETEPGRPKSVYAALGLQPEDILHDLTFESHYDYVQAYVAGPDYDSSLIEGPNDVQGEEDAGLQQETARQESEGTEGEEDESFRRHFVRPREPVYLLNRRLRRPWCLDDLPMMAAWLATNSPALDLIARAANRPTFAIPVTQIQGLPGDTGSSECQRLCWMAAGLRVRANYRIATGDLDAAMDDILATKRLGRHLRNSGQSFALHFAVDLEGFATSFALAGSLPYPPTNRQINRLVNELEQLAPPSRMDEPIQFHRFWSLDEFQAVAAGRMPSLYDHLTGKKFGPFGCDWNTVAKRTNEHYDALLTQSRVQPVELQPIDWLSIRMRSIALADVYFNESWGWFEKLQDSIDCQTCAERIQAIALAMLLYHNDHGTLPPAYTVDAEGNPLHSWRVLVLPYLGQQALYDQIHLDQPWDSPQNRALHEADVPFYQCPAANLTAGRTTYAVVVGPNVPFDGAKAKRLSDFGPKSANMILVVERQQGFCWMDPGQDVPQSIAALGINNRNGTAAGIASPHPGGANFALRSGAVSFISVTIDSLLFEAILQGKSDRIP